METKNENNINIEKIVGAGKALKSIFTAVLLLNSCFLIGILVATNSTDFDTIKKTYILIGFLSLIINIFVLYNLYEAGDNLVNVNLLPEGVANYNSIIAELNVKIPPKREFAEGGIVVHTDQNGEHGLVCSKIDLGIANWNDAKKLCANYESDGFSDWRLPNRDELQLIYTDIHMKEGDFTGTYYWSSTEYNDESGYIWRQDFGNGIQDYYDGKYYKFTVRAVRSF